ncbi:ribosomal-processing cysteine protease Prp [Lactobacillus sp. YT155]|uniref:ribosomal-processing cysteine protease Prp n=1 Tax=Lactobacillus sp. YT155 TaxID=3060955 RepID=UPI002660125E|nr:ribosomal-processing cysteine protease Prp [Lactobacillus sp. YT155]MDO1605564.1 ribosomal-processing cysteine protease Prp [Lactobacillus sp. YT155]
MIKASFKRDSQNRITDFILTGHADYGEDDELDIVCSAVSVISIGTNNSIEKLVGVEPKVKLDEKNGGYLELHVDYDNSETINHDVALLLENFNLIYKSIVEQYPVFVQYVD